MKGLSSRQYLYLLEKCTCKAYNWHKRHQLEGHSTWSCAHLHYLLRNLSEKIYQNCNDRVQPRVKSPLLHSYSSDDLKGHPESPLRFRHGMRYIWRFGQCVKQSESSFSVPTLSPCTLPPPIRLLGLAGRAGGDRKGTAPEWAGEPGLGVDPHFRRLHSYS